jgi:hypothetical protein
MVAAPRHIAIELLFHFAHVVFLVDAQCRYFNGVNSP